MTAQRVLATDAARDAAQRMSQILHNGLDREIQQVLQAGRTLSDPRVWDGAAAAQFRKGSWPQHLAVLGSTLQALERLDDHVQQVVRDILAAGGQGTLAAVHGVDLHQLEAWAREAHWDLTAALKAWAAIKFAKTSIAVARMVKAFRDFPELAQALYGERVGQVALAFDRGEATLAELEAASASAMRSIDAAEVFTKVPAMRAVVGGSGALATVGKIAAPLAVAADVYTVIHPGRPGIEGNAIQVAAGANAIGTIAALGVINASVDWIPVAGQVVAVGTGLFLAGDWAYHNVPAFHDFCNTVGHDTVSVAEDTWHGVEHAGGSVAHFVSSLF